jgi:hypothetical protein
MADENQTNQNFEELNRNLQKLLELQQTQMQLQNIQNSRTREASASLNNFGDDLEESARAWLSMTKEQREEYNRTKKAQAYMETGLGKLGDGVMSAGKAMLDGKKGAAAMNDSLGQLTQAATLAGAALMMLIPGGPIIKGLIAGLTAVTAGVTKYAQAANEMSDKLYTGYAGMAKAGAAASDGMTGLFEDSKKLGLSMNELGDFVNIVTANAKDLTLFGGGVFEGRKRLAEMGKALEGNRESFIKMGLSMQDVTEGMVGYIKQQRVAGNLNKQTTDQLAEGARKYLMEQDALTKLTGMARQEQESAREQIRSQERFAAKLEELRQQGRSKEAKALEDTYLVLYSQNKEAAQGFADISTNNVQTEAAQKSLMGTQGESMRVAQQISAGQIDAAEGAQRVAKAHGDTATRLGATMGQIGTYSQSMGDLAGDLRLRGLAEQDVQKVLAKIEEDRKKQGAEGGQAADALVEQQGKLRNTQINANEAMERFVFAGIVPAQNAMIGLAEATLRGTNALNRMFGITESEEAKAKKAANEERAKDLTLELDTKNKELESLQNNLGKAKEAGNEAEVQKLKAQVKKAEDDKFALERGKATAESGVMGSSTFEGFEQRAGGSLAAAGNLIEDFGKGTPAMLHGREGVITEQQLRQFGDMAMKVGMGSVVAGDAAAAPAAGATGGASGARQIMTSMMNQMDTMLDYQRNFGVDSQDAQASTVDNLRRIDNITQQSRLELDQDRLNVDNFVDRRRTLYDSILANLDQQFQITKATTGSQAPAGGGAAGTAAPGAAPSGVTGGAAGEISGMPSGGGAPANVDAKDYVKFTGGTGSQEHFGKLSDNVESAFLMMARDYNALTGGKILQVNSAFRSVEEQANVDSGTNPKAAPGMSLHNVGRALDIQSAQRTELEQLGLLAKYGFRPLAGDPPHISMAEGGIAHGPDSGYPATLHGTEAVIPLGDGALTMSVPSVDTLVGVTEDMSSSITGLRDEIRTMMTGLQDAMGRNNTADLQGRMVDILENINKSQTRTADASVRMAQAATN